MISDDLTLMKEYINKKGGIVKVSKSKFIYKTFIIQAGYYNDFGELQIDWNLTICRVSEDLIYDHVVDAKTFLMYINKWDYMDYDNCELIIPR